MDPKTLASLDPKLRETYEKVMGTSGAPATAITNSPAAAPIAVIPTTEANKQKIEPSIPAPADADPNPIITSIPIPPPSSTAPSNPQPQDLTPASTTPIQPSDLAGLQPSLSGSPLPDMKVTAGQIKPLQPLPSPASVNQVNVPSGGTSPFIRILYTIAGTIFFIVYAIFWMKIFNYPLPF